jgi:hypothetical protein
MLLHNDRKVSRYTTAGVKYRLATTEELLELVFYVLSVQWLIEDQLLLKKF